MRLEHYIFYVMVRYTEYILKYEIYVLEFLSQSWLCDMRCVDIAGDNNVFYSRHTELILTWAGGITTYILS